MTAAEIANKLAESIVADAERYRALVRWATQWTELTILKDAEGQWTIALGIEPTWDPERPTLDAVIDARRGREN